MLSTLLHILFCLVLSLLGATEVKARGFKCDFRKVFFAENAKGENYLSRPH